MSRIDQFYSYLKDLDENYTRLAELLRRKVVAIGKQNLAELDSIIKEEQVYVLMSKGFDQNLRQYRDDLNLRGENLGSVIEELPEERREAFHILHQNLRTTLDGVQSLSEKCRELLEGRLTALDHSIKTLDHSENATYHKGGRPGPQTGPGLFTKSV